MILHDKEGTLADTIRGPLLNPGTLWPASDPADIRTDIDTLTQKLRIKLDMPSQGGALLGFTKRACTRNFTWPCYSDIAWRSGLLRHRTGLRRKLRQVSYTASW